MKCPLCGGAVVDAEGNSWPYCVDCGWQADERDDGELPSETQVWP